MKTYTLATLALVLLGFHLPMQAQWVKTLSVIQDNGGFDAFAVLGTNIFAGSERSGVFRSTDNGISWAAVSSGMPDSAVFSLAVSGTNLFAGSYGGVFLSTNNGTTWTGASNRLGISFVGALAVSPDGAGRTNLFAGSYGGVYLSTNNGTSWTVVDTVYGDEGIHSLLVSGTNIFAVYGPEKTISPYSTEGLLLSTDSGTSWREVKPGLPDFAVSSVAVAGTNLFTGGIGVNRSTNNGTTWTVDTVGMGSTGVISFAVSGTNVFAGTYSRGVFLSTNNHTSWTAVNSGLPIGNSSYVRALTSMGTYLFAGTDDGVWRRPLSEMITSVEPAIRELPSVFLLSQNYPNPFNPTTTIRYTLPHRSHVTLTVYNTLGQKIAELINADTGAGYHEVKFDGSRLASGMYVYRLQAGDYLAAKKLILLK